MYNLSLLVFKLGFKFQDSILNGCQSDIAIFTIKVLITIVLFLELANLKQFIC